MITDLIIGAVESNTSILAPNGAPSALTLTVNDDTKITLNWTIGSTNHDGHRIYISTDGVTFTEKGTVTGSTATYQATGLTQGTQYYFYVVAYRGSIESIASNTEDATTWTEGEAVIRASGTVGWYDFAVENVRKDGSDNISIWYDKIVGSSSFGPELSSGTLIPYNFYIITATEPNKFYGGCKVGDIFQEESAPTTLNANNRVKQLNGNHLGTLYPFVTTAMPLWTSDGVVFNGVNSGMRSNRFTYATPQMVYLVVKQVTWTSLDSIISAAEVDNAMLLQQRGTTPGLKIFGGITTSDQNNNLPLDTWGIVRACFNGESSSFQINETAQMTGNYGSTTANGIVLGANRFNADKFSNIIVKEAIFRSVADDAATQTKIYNYLSNKYGVGGT